MAGTFCGGEIQGTFAEKRESCLDCDFYDRVQAEEGTANLRTKFLKFVFDTKSPIFNDTLKIIDFGFACPRGAENFLTGTPFYMAPEQVKCLPVDERTDIYCLGITAFEMFTGKRPYPDKDGWTVMEMHVKQDIQDPAEIVPNLPEALRKFIIKACARDPNHRFQSVVEALEILESAEGEMNLKPKTTSRHL